MGILVLDISHLIEQQISQLPILFNALTNTSFHQLKLVNSDEILIGIDDAY